MQILQINCDRCHNEIYMETTEVKIRFGGKTFGSVLAFDLCPECREDLRTFLKTEPKDENQ